MSMTSHCLGKNFNKKTVVVRVTPFPIRHTAENITELIKDIIAEFKISRSKIHLIVRDNAANVVRAIKDTPYDSLSCFLRTLQLMINDCIFDQKMVKDII